MKKYLVFLSIFFLTNQFGYGQLVSKIVDNTFRAEWIDFKEDGEVAFKISYEFNNDSIRVKKTNNEDKIEFLKSRREILNYFKYSEFLKDSIWNLYNSKSQNIKPKEYDGLITFYYQNNEAASKRYYFKNGSKIIKEEYFKNLIYEKIISIDTFAFLNNKKSISLDNIDMFSLISVLKVPYEGFKRTRNGNAEIYNGYVNFGDKKNFDYKSFYRIPGTYEIESSQGSGLFINGNMLTLDYNTFNIKIPVYDLQKYKTGEIDIIFNRLDNQLSINISNTGIKLFHTGKIEGANLSKILFFIGKYFPEINFEILRRNEKIKYLQYFKEEQRLNFIQSIIGKYINAGRLDVAQNDYPELLNFQDAKNISEILGDGWRLPTIGDLKYIDNIITNDKNKFNLYNFRNTNYWSSSYDRYLHSTGWLEDPSKILVYNFNRSAGSRESINYPGNIGKVRAVRGLSSEILATIGGIKKINTLIISERDYPRGVKFQEISDVLKEFGTNDGWRLPSENELNFLFENNSEYNLGLGRRSNFYLTNEIYRNKGNSTRNIDYKVRVIRAMTKSEIIEAENLKIIQKQEEDLKISSLQVFDYYYDGIVMNISETRDRILIFTDLKKIKNYGAIDKSVLYVEGWRLPDIKEVKLFKKAYNESSDFRMKFSGKIKKDHYYFYFLNNNTLERFEVGNGYFTSPESDKENNDFLHYFYVKEVIIK